ncbi:unnamed protein product [Mytilus edulis]|uniref:MAM domain-containing protein n=1 Tax=Mytilus edulis TaxID=6550 RepID=A0A8S3VLL4_MYTED|nr:unnamed protein product [Mytilus edulis]
MKRNGNKDCLFKKWGFFEGDIELDGETRNAVNTHYYRSATWPNATEVRNTYLQAMKEIEEDTKVHGKTCVKFVPKTSQHHDYIYILPQTGYPVTDSVLFDPFCVNNFMLIWVAAHLVECDFEHGITSGKCNLQQLHDDQFDWTLKTGPSGVSGSGPLADHTNGAGHYLLADARHHHNKKTRIQTTTLPSGVNCIEFSYFVHGSQVKTFLIRAEAPRIHHTIKQWSGSQTNGWMTQRINMNVPLSWKVSCQFECSFFKF